MERNINKQIETYLSTFKEDIKNKLFEFEPFLEKHKANAFLEYVYDYNRLILTKDDFVKRKRTPCEIPENERCTAVRTTGEQCSRRKKTNSTFCGTHAKQNEETPSGPPQPTTSQNETDHTLDVYAENIAGILYYIDKFNNVYKTDDILENKKNPEIIAKCVFENNVWKLL